MGEVVLKFGADMQNCDLNPEQVAQLGEATLENFGAFNDEKALAQLKPLNDFARANAITISYAHFYLVFGALNFPQLDDGRVMFAGITPAQAAKLLNYSPARIASGLMPMTEKGLVGRDISGAYKVASVNLWFELANALTLSS